ncbi:unnamed protein product, partial [Ixodes persulcatus]
VLTSRSALFCALVNNFYVSLGLNGLVSQANHTISDVKTLYQKTKREVDFVLVRNYNEFKADMFLKLESCIKATEDDFADIYEDTPFVGLSEVADRLGNATTTLRTAGGHVTDLNTLVSGMHALETRIRGHLGSAFAKCNTTPTNLPLSDCMKVKSVENVIVSGAPRGRDWISIDGLAAAESELSNPTIKTFRTTLTTFTQTLPRKTTYLAEVNRSVDEIRYVVETVGGNLEQISGRFNMPWGRHPDTLIKYRGKLENLLAELDEPLRRYLLAAYALLAVLACPVMVFLVGLCCGCCCAPTNGCCGRGCCGGCCLSCAAYFLAIAFGVSMTAAVPAMFAGHATQGSTCDVFEDLGGPTSRSLVQFVLAELRKRNIGVRGRSRVGTRLPLNHVSTETMMDIAKRFSQCGETPYSLFRLLGEELVRNITRRMGKPWNLTWIVDGGGPINFRAELDKFSVVPAAAMTVPPLDPLTARLVDLRALNFSMLDVPDYQRQANNRPLTYDLSAVTAQVQALTLDGRLNSLRRELDLGLSELRQLVMIHTTFQEKVTELLTELDKVEHLLTINGSRFGDYAADKVRESVNNAAKVTVNFHKLRGLSNSHTTMLAKTVDFYLDHVREQVRENIGDCRPAYGMYKGIVNSVCTDLVLPFNGFWLSVVTFLLVGIFAMVTSLYLSSLYSATAVEEVSVNISELLPDEVATIALPSSPPDVEEPLPEEIRWTTASDHSR